jgi:capsular exopolysaccharide synthesis family protein
MTEAAGEQGLPMPSPATSNALTVLSRRRWWIVLCAIASMATAWFYLTRQTPIYGSYSRLYVQYYGKLVDDKGLETQASTTATQSELISSTPLLTEVAELPEIRDMEIMKGIENPTAFIKSGLTVNPDKDFISIGYESPNRIEAAQLVNAIADAYVSFTSKQHHNNAAEVLKILQKEKEKCEQELEMRRKASLDFLRSHDILSFRDSDKGNIVLQKLSRLSESLTAAQLEVMEAQALLDSAEAAKSDPAKLLDMAKAEQPKEMEVSVDRGEGGNDSIFRRLYATRDAIQNDIDQTERLLDKLRRTRTPEHKDLKNAQQDLLMFREQLKRNDDQIEARRTQMTAEETKLQMSRNQQRTLEAAARRKELDQQLIDSYLGKLRRRAVMGKQRERQLSDNFNEQRQKAFDLNTAAYEYGALEADYNRTAGLVNLLAERIKGINVGEDTGVVTVNVIEPARPGDAPIRPDKKKILGMGLILGLVLGVGLAFALDFLDQRIHSTEEVAALLGVPVLGLVPNISTNESPSVRGRKVVLEPSSDISEAYRTIRTAVYFAARDEKTKKLLITSPAPGDGKTTSASNLAIAMAQAGQRVLLLDADFRRPTLHKIFEIVPDVGLSSVMSGLAPLEKAIYRTEVENLHLCPCGPIPRNPSEILNGQAFADLLESLERKYDHIVIDSPPVAPVTDARILGALCDETILVLRAEKSTRRVSEHARVSLVSVGANILGVIVNDVPRNRKGYRYYSGYGYGYRYYRYGYGYGTDPKAAAKPAAAPAATTTPTP